MSSIKNVSLAVLALTVTLASEAAGQARPAAPRQTAQRQQTVSAPNQGFWELGLDMNVGIGINDPKQFFINIPTGLVRAGYYVSPVLSLEPALAFNSVARENATAVSAWMLQLGVLYHLTPVRTKGQMYVHPSLAFSGGSGGGDNLTFLGAGFGMKQPMLDGRLACRLELGLNHRLKSGAIPSRTNIIASAGWSVYTR
jgi:hypothetical protein